jgi:DNA polymerase I-like protein with 3'-5' exonuclease and polymerase domains
MYKIFDSETETHHSFKRKSNPFDPRNYIVMRGHKRQDHSCATSEHFLSKSEVTPLVIEDDVTLLVGHNIKFDLLYEMTTPGGYENLRAYYNRGGKIWCTQYAEYLLRGQQKKSQMVAMDTIVESYGGRLKVDGLKALWQAGVLTSEINPDLLRDYLIGTVEEGRNSGDIGNTELIYLGQLKLAEELGMLHTIQVRMDGLLATTEMEYNGLKIDMQAAKEDLQLLITEQRALQERLDAYIKDVVPEEVGFSWTSGTHVSCLLFGGTIRYQKRETYIDTETGELARLKATEDWPLFDGKPLSPAKLTAAGASQDASGRWTLSAGGRTFLQDVFASGKKAGDPKTKKVSVPGELKVKWQDFFFKLPGITEPDPEWKTALTDGMGGPIYSTDKDTIAELGTRDIPFLKEYARNAAIQKDMGTYYVTNDGKKMKGMLTCVDPASLMIHHSLNHVMTVTTRLSSSEPNLQNLPRADKSRVKRMFVSRFGEDGDMVEIDYAQLEVVVQGLLSNDPNLVRDLIAKIDFHCKRVALKYKCTYEEALYWCKDETFTEFKLWKKRRTAAKEFSFQRAYGAGAAGISATTGIPVDDVKAMIELEEAEYAGVKKYNDSVEREVLDTAYPFRDPDRGFRQFRKGTYTAPTGTQYVFRTYDAPAWQRKKGVVDTFMPTELKNYPIQGTGGEIVQMVLGVLFRLFMLKNNWDGKAFLVNTVHDCYWIDCHKSVSKEVADTVLRVMTSVPQLLKRFYGIDCPVPFPAEAEHGPNMYELKHFH